MEEAVEYLAMLKDVRKSYGRHVVLDQLNLSVGRREMLAVTGPSGSGKSTMLNILGMLERPDSGTVEICGVRNPELRRRDGRHLLSRKVAYLFQNFALIDDGTVYSNLAVPLSAIGIPRRRWKDAMRSALRAVDLDSVLEQPVATLSGGEQQRLACARVLLRPVELLLADEPTGALDSGNRDTVLHLMQHWNQEGMTVVVVTHDPAVVKVCERTLTLGEAPIGLGSRGSHN